MSAYHLLAEPIQRALWNMKWMDLRPIQEQAIPIILKTNQDLIISARTAAGKTEAAFLPVLSAIYGAAQTSVRALYVGPLKALINDQFRRIEQLAQLAEIPVYRWHGDVDSGRKQTALENPAGIMLLTPESLEAMFIHRGDKLENLFCHLSFVVLDELHALLGTERGLHLRSLLFRLQRLASERIRLVALSATLGDLPRSAVWLRPEASDQVEILTDAASQKLIEFRIHGYLVSKPDQDTRAAKRKMTDLDSSQPPAKFDDPSPIQSQNESLPVASDPGQTGDSSEPLPLSPGPGTGGLPELMLQDMYESFRGHKNLIFANSKSLVEQCVEGLNQLCIQHGHRTEFLVHHGSLAKSTREETESLMQGRLAYTAVCSSTLELGIDIGNVSTVGQIGSPHSVNSLAQRMGRSGRKDGEPHRMRIFIKMVEAKVDDPPHEQLYLELIQAIAVTELMRQKWFEPPNSEDGDLSTLVQQILSVLAETGGLPAKELHERLVLQGAFRGIDRSTFAKILRSLGEHNLIEQMPQGDLILGMKGLEVVNDHEFYSAFTSAEEYRVIYGTQLIGSLTSSNIPPRGDHMKLGGRGWKITDIDSRRREVLVTPGSGTPHASFSNADRSVHAKLRYQMRAVLSDSNDFPYLNRKASELLSRSRENAVRLGVLTGKLISHSAHACLWFPWTGTKALKTLEAMAMLKEIPVKQIGIPAIALEFSRPAEEVRGSLRQYLSEAPSVIQLAEKLEPKRSRKYDEYLSLDLLNWGLSRVSIDLENALGVLKNA